MIDPAFNSALHPGEFTLYVIYDHPRDHPEWWVVRPWDLQRGAPAVAREACGLFSDLDKARAYCAQFGKTRMLPLPGDDPVIVEVWL